MTVNMSYFDDYYPVNCHHGIDTSWYDCPECRREQKEWMEQEWEEEWWSLTEPPIEVYYDVNPKGWNGE